MFSEARYFGIQKPMFACIQSNHNLFSSHLQLYKTLLGAKISSLTEKSTTCRMYALIPQSSVYDCVVVIIRQ